MTSVAAKLPAEPADGGAAIAVANVDVTYGVGGAEPVKALSAISLDIPDTEIIRGPDGHWLITDQERLSSVENLYRLALNRTKQFDARNFTVKAEDLDWVIVRENSEGLYSRMGGLTESNATDINLFTERGVRRIAQCSRKCV